MAPADTSSGVSFSSAPMTPTLIPLTLNTLDAPSSQSGISPVAVSTTFVARNGNWRALDVRLEPVDAVVELVVAERRGVEPPRVLDVDRRHVLEQARIGRRGADVVTGGEEQPGSGQVGELLVEHGREVRRATHRAVDTIERERRRVELAVEVGEADDRDRLVARAALDHVEQDAALAVLRLRDAEDERERRREVDRPRAHGALGDARARRRGTSPACSRSRPGPGRPGRSRAGRRSGTSDTSVPGAAASNW